jgi:hypothetical protein
MAYSPTTSNLLAPVSRIRGFDRVLLELDRNPSSFIYRGIIGLLAAHVASRFQPYPHAHWIYLAVIFLSLFILRVSAALLRRLVPVSSVVREIWGKRRGLGKNFDSYQWSKLLGFGLGIGLHWIAVHRWWTIESTVASCCVLSGAIGMIRWRSIQRDLRLQVL